MGRLCGLFKCSKLSFIVKLQNIGYNIVKYLNKSASSLSRYVS